MGQGVAGQCATSESAIPVGGYSDTCRRSPKRPGQHLALDWSWVWVSGWLGQKAGADLALGRNTELRKSWLLAEVRPGITQCVRRAETNDECEKVHKRTRSEQHSSSSFVRVFHNCCQVKAGSSLMFPTWRERKGLPNIKSNSAWKFQQAQIPTWTQRHVQEKFTSYSTKIPGVCSERVFDRAGRPRGRQESCHRSRLPSDQWMKNCAWRSRGGRR